MCSVGLARGTTAGDLRNRQPLTVAVMLETDGPDGAELLTHQVCAELRRRGHRVVPVGPENGEGWLSARLRDSGFERRTFSLRRALDGRALREMTRMLRDAGVQVVHSHEFTMGIYGAAAARWLGISHVVTMHGDQGVTAAWRRRVALRWAFRHSQAAVAVADHTRRAMEERLGLRDHSLAVVHNGITVPIGRRERLRRELGLGEGDVLMLAVGSLRPNKGHRVLIDALSGLRRCEGLPRWQLAIAGRGEEREALRRRAEELGLAEQVHLLGQREDIGDVHAAADVFAMPSYSEGLPLALLEAMFAGSAIVASDVGGIPEAVADEKEALLTPPGNPEPLRRAIARLLGDAALRRRIAAAARRRADAEFRIERMVDRYDTLYRGRPLEDGA